MIKTIQTYVTIDHQNQFDAFLREYRLDNFHLLRERSSQNLIIQFYNKNDHEYFLKQNLDAKFLIRFYSSE